MANNFDFFVGTWQTTQRKTKPFSGTGEWETADGSVVNYSLFEGAANVDEVDLPGFGFRGISLRLQDPVTQDWSIYWVNSRNGQLALPPVVGRFDEQGVGEFFSEEEFEGRQIRVRYRWSGITEKSARWEQAFSVDDGGTWETNWEADFTRS
ncbi:hypothetical protein [Actinophytocola glycyrrhizae]|uniref:DUF1579 domain-containing protein n=1 Tax=Actinophytocola glycyrrhizae TaxID=2044873 RepID=A0ABV9SF97_9PSEU